MVLELKEGISNSFESSIVFSTYSNNKTFVSSYMAIFEALWKYIDLFEKFKEIDKKHELQESNLEKQIELKTQYLLKINDNLEEINEEFIRKEKALKKTNKELIENEHKKGESISMIAHELRTPLVLIQAIYRNVIEIRKYGKIK